MNNRPGGNYKLDPIRVKAQDCQGLEYRERKQQGGTKRNSSQKRVVMALGGMVVETAVVLQDDVRGYRAETSRARKRAPVAPVSPGIANNTPPWPQ